MKLKMERSVYNRQGKKTTLPKITKVVWPSGLPLQETKKPFYLAVTYEDLGTLKLKTVITKNPVTGSLVVNGLHFSGRTFVAREDNGYSDIFMVLKDEEGNDIRFLSGTWHL